MKSRSLLFKFKMMKLTKKLNKVFSKNRGPKKELTVEQKISRRNFISFGSFLVLGSAAYGGWRWLYTSPEEVPGITAEAHKPLRAVLNANEKVVRQLYSNLVKTYPKEMAAKVVRHNSDIGSEGLVDVDAWKLSVKKSSGEVLNIGIDEIRKLPKTEIIYDFKCVEGWDQISHWGGVKFSDFIAHFKLDAETEFGYVGMETPDKEYYVGVDMPSAMHPQTLLAYEVNEKPLPPKHGAPLRLIIPVKYGIKNLKRIGSINFSNNRPRDYWAEQGYDYYAGL
jgi:DMSO/TMAO reductase YedYZ molybdopterin-dependent catalytic subunit